MTATVSTAEAFKKFLPSSMVHVNGYETDIADQYLEHIIRMSEQNKKKETTLILDDIMYESKKAFGNKTQKQLAMNGRHYFSSVFATTQYSMLVPVDIRSNFDFVLALKETNRSNKRRLYEHFFGCFPSFNQFEKVFDECTKEHGCLVLDRTQTSNTVEDIIKFYRAKANLPAFRIGKPIFFKLNEFINEEVKKRKKNTSKVKTI